MVKIIEICKDNFITWVIAVIFALGTFYGLTNNRLSINEKNIAENKTEIVIVKKDLKELNENIYKVLTEQNTRLSRIEGKIEGKK